MQVSDAERKGPRGAGEEWKHWAWDSWEALDKTEVCLCASRFQVTLVASLIMSAKSGSDKRIEQQFDFYRDECSDYFLKHES